MWPFGQRPVVDRETAAWHFDHFAWLTREFAPRHTTPLHLVLPRPGFFPTDGEQGHARALRIFSQVKAHCGLTGLDADLIPDDNPLARPAPVAPLMVVPQKHALGTFSLSGNRAQISYVPALLEQPQALIATFAHELSHYLLATAASPPPCDDDEMEFLTDLTAVYLGFGVFLANSRFDFSVLRDGQMEGWRMSHSGYLPEADLIFALALFIKGHDLDAAPARACLKPHLAKMLGRALRDIHDDDPALTAIRSRASNADPPGEP